MGTALVVISGLGIFSSIGVFVVSLILKIIFSITKKEEKKKKASKAVIISTIAFFVCLVTFIVVMIVAPKLDPVGWCSHEYSVVEQQDSTCTKNGFIKKVCPNCNDEVIEYIDAHHSWVEEIISEATCTSQKQLKKTCARCEITEYEIVDGLLNHSWIEDSIIVATCSHPKQLVNKCSVCGTTETIEEGSPTPHSFGDWTVSIEPTTEKEGQQTRKCMVCDHSENAIILKKSPITIVNQSYSIDFLGGVELTRKIKNNTSKTIKYITLEWQCYNAVDDLIRDTITGESTQRKYWTGPFESGTTTNLTATGFYNSTFSNAVLTEIQIEFMDGEIITVTSKEYSDIFN